MRKSWIKKLYRNAKRKLTQNYLHILLVSLIAEKKEPSRLQKETKPVFKITKSDLLLILGVTLILITVVYITYRTGALESTRYYQIK